MFLVILPSLRIHGNSNISTSKYSVSASSGVLFSECFITLLTFFIHFFSFIFFLNLILIGKLYTNYLRTIIIIMNTHTAREGHLYSLNLGKLHNHKQDFIISTFHIYPHIINNFIYLFTYLFIYLFYIAAYKFATSWYFYYNSHKTLYVCNVQ